jgi:hypothetical protein
LQSILEKVDIPASQRKAHESSTMVEYTSKLDIYSHANRSLPPVFPQVLLGIKFWIRIH